MAGLVQTSGKKETITGGTTVVFTAPSNFTVGNWVVICWTTNPYLSNLTGGGGTAVNSDNANFPFGFSIDGISSFQVVNSGTNDVTFSFPSGTTNTVTCSFEEWDNFQTATPLDKAPAPGGGASIASGVLSQASEVVYAIGITNPVTGSGITGPSGWNNTITEGGASFTNAAAGYLVVNATSSVTATFTNCQDCVLVSYKTAAGGSYTLTATQGSYSHSGQSVGLVYSQVSSYTLVANFGSYTLTGSDALIDTSIGLVQGSYSLNGQIVNLLFNRVVTNSSGGYTLSGQSVGLLYSGAPITGNGTGILKRLYLGVRMGL